MDKNKVKIDFGNKLRKYRELAGLTQAELGEACGYSNKTTISKIEQGLQGMPHSKIMLAANRLGISPLVFYTDDAVNDITESNLLSTFRQLSDNGKEDALHLLSTFCQLSFRGKEDVINFTDYQLQRELDAGKKESKDQPAANEE